MWPRVDAQTGLAPPRGIMVDMKTVYRQTPPTGPQTAAHVLEELPGRFRDKLPEDHHPDGGGRAAPLDPNRPNRDRIRSVAGTRQRIPAPLRNRRPDPPAPAVGLTKADAAARS